MYICVFFFNDTATTEIYTLSLHDALPIFPIVPPEQWETFVTRLEHTSSGRLAAGQEQVVVHKDGQFMDVSIWNSLIDRKSTRLNSSHANISYAVFCLKKKKKTLCRSTHCF